MVKLGEKGRGKDEAYGRKKDMPYTGGWHGECGRDRDYDGTYMDRRAT